MHTSECDSSKTNAASSSFYDADPATLACFAAIQLDRLSRGTSAKTDTLPLLATWLHSSMPTVTDRGDIMSLTDPKAVIAVDAALNESFLKKLNRDDSATTAETVAEAKRVATLLGELAAGLSPEQIAERKTDITNATMFCRALTRRMLASLPSSEIYANRDF